MILVNMKMGVSVFTLNDKQSQRWRNQTYGHNGFNTRRRAAPDRPE